ncbi:hypothetical protein TNCV_1963661 [Trichonephila clavipes]|nr:hypothetical protein TNCV_1963661 [Trichonephila clavipes]
MSLVYADKPQTLDYLEDNIRRVIADIWPQMLEKVIGNWTSRLDYIRASRGSPMPEIIFKIFGPLLFRASAIFLIKAASKKKTSSKLLRAFVSYPSLLSPKPKNVFLSAFCVDTKQNAWTFAADT